jgi:hypothetical protein
MKQRMVQPLMLTLFVIAVLAAPSAVVAGDRIVAVGDVHGSYEGLVSILQRAELIDEDNHWVGGKATLVQTGDLFDRGLQIREVLDLLIRLQDEAATAGGKVVVLLGNHEGMNLIGFFRDVNPDVYATFADAKSEKRRKKAYRNFQQSWDARAAAGGFKPPVFTSEIEAKWMAAYPPGFIEYMEALGPEGRYGKWLRTLPVAVLFGDVLFIHGGVGPELRGSTVEEINLKVAGELAVFDKAREYMINERLIPTTADLNSMVAEYRKMEEPNPILAGLDDVDHWYLRWEHGPLWFRGGAKWDEETQGAEMAEILDGIGALRVVGGHSVQHPARIQVRFDGRIFLIDTGMLKSHYDGQPSALVIEGGSFTAIYADGGEDLLLEEALPEAA